LRFNARFRFRENSRRWRVAMWLHERRRTGYRRIVPALGGLIYGLCLIGMMLAARDGPAALVAKQPTGGNHL
jgi:hypothetical protein